MDKKAKAVETIKAYRGLVDQALKIVTDVPFYKNIDRPEWARLTIDGDNAELSWFSGWEDVWEDSTEFPAYLLFITDEEFQVIKGKYEREEAEKQAKAIKDQQAKKEVHDRAEFERLSKKYGK